MTREKLGLLACLATIAIPAPAAAAEEEAVTPASLSEATIEELKLGKYKEAVDGFFSGMPLMSGKAQELALLVSQIEATMKIYGPIQQCNVLESERKAALIERRTYLCQHSEFVTYWQFDSMKLPQNWAGFNMVFNDQTTKLF